MLNNASTAATLSHSNSIHWHRQLGGPETAQGLAALQYSLLQVGKARATKTRTFCRARQRATSSFALLSPPYSPLFLVARTGRSAGRGEAAGTRAPYAHGAHRASGWAGMGTSGRGAHKQLMHSPALILPPHPNGTHKSAAAWVKEAGRRRPLGPTSTATWSNQSHHRSVCRNDAHERLVASTHHCSTQS